MKYDINDLIDTYEQSVKVCVEQKGGKWILTVDGDEYATLPEEIADDYEDAAWWFEHKGYFAEIEEWLEEEYEREQQEWEDYRKEVIATYWQNAI